MDDLRLKLLELTYTHGRDASEAVARAKELEKYVMEGVIVTPHIPTSKPVGRRSRAKPKATDSDKP